jgi:hypothetical protein
MSNQLKEDNLVADIYVGKKKEKKASVSGMLLLIMIY